MKNKRPFLEAIPYERYRFEKERVGFGFNLTRRQFEQMKGWELEQYETDMGTEIIYRVSRLMAVGERTIEAIETVPVSWWDHLKHDMNRWAADRLGNPHFFFTQIAKAVSALSLKPKFRKIEKSTLIKNFCPHVADMTNTPHIEFLLHRQTPFYLGGD